MKKEIKNGVLKGYEIGKNISIHSHINDPENWCVTIRPLKIHAQSLCKKECTEAEIARFVNVLLHKELSTLTELVEDVTPLIEENKESTLCVLCGKKPKYGTESTCLGCTDDINW